MCGTEGATDSTVGGGVQWHGKCSVGKNVHQQNVHASLKKYSDELVDFIEEFTVFFAFVVTAYLG